MLHVSIQDSFDPLSDSDIAAFESELRAPLPVDYRSFLLQYNGGSFADQVGFVPDGADEAALFVDELYGLNADCPGSDLRHVIELLQGSVKHRSGYLMPIEIIPVAQTAGGEVCLGVLGEHIRGHVFDWDQEEDYEDDDAVLGLWELSASFDEFMGGLRIVLPETSRETHPLFRAVEAGDLYALNEALARGANSDARNEHGWTLLFAAAFYTRLDCARFLIEAGAQVDSPALPNGTTPLHVTSSADMARLLLHHGADPNAADQRGYSVLMGALEYNRRRKARLLVEAGADVTHVAANGETAMSLCRGSLESFGSVLVQRDQIGDTTENHTPT